MRKFHKKTPYWCIDGEKLDDEELEYRITVKPNVEILMPKKNVQHLFNKK